MMTAFPEVVGRGRQAVRRARLIDADRRGMRAARRFLASRGAVVAQGSQRLIVGRWRGRGLAVRRDPQVVAVLRL